MLLFWKWICLCLFFFGEGMPLKAAMGCWVLPEKFASLPYGFGILIAIFLFFVIILSYVYDHEDKDAKGCGRWVCLVILVVLYFLVDYFL